MQPIHQIGNVLKTPRLTSIPINRQWFILEGLNDEIGNNASVVGMHAWTEGVEDAGDADVDLVLISVGVHHGFGDAFSFVVAGAGADGVDVSPVGFGLGVDFGVSVDLHFVRCSVIQCDLM